MWRVGVDTGGTFTDLIAYDAETGDLATFKTASSPAAPGRALLDALTGPEIPPAALANLVHGTTVATNALIERKGANVAFVTTRGFEDVLYIQRTNRRDHYNFDWDKPKPLVQSRRNCFGVDERTLADASILKLVDPKQMAAIARKIRRAGCDAIAISFLFAFLNPDNELAAARCLAEALPDVPISTSHAVTPIWREFERGNTVVADAYLKPIMGRYVRSASSSLSASGYAMPWSVMKSNGGAMAHAAAAERPVHSIMSGPAGGMIASRHFARLSGYDRVCTLDMGGTSADVGLILDGELRFTSSYEVDFGQPVAVPMISVRSIGAGGGSIAWLDAGGMLHVGPQSAGVNPGPACYGRGGDDATVTDADLALGRLEPSRFLGGRMRLDQSQAEAAVDRLGSAMGLGRRDAALAIVDVTNSNMANAIRLATIREGHDPRDFALLAFGGAGGLHATTIAESCWIGTVLVPPYPGLFSALGLVLADVRVDRAWNRILDSTTATADILHAAIETLRRQVESELRAEGFAGLPDYAVTVGMRYLGQNYETEVAFDPRAAEKGSLAALYEAFHRRHEAKYGYRQQNEIVEMVQITVSAFAASPKFDLRAVNGAQQRREFGRKEVAFARDLAVQCPVVNRAFFKVGEEIPGPFLVAEDDATTLIGPGDTVLRNEHDVLVIRVGAARRG